MRATSLLALTALVLSVTSAYGKNDANGSHCSRSDQCLSNFCNRSRCDDKKPNGQSCYKDNGCQSAYCRRGTCDVKKPVQHVCYKDSGCQTGYCRRGKCDVKKVGGHLCYKDSGCLGNRCRNGKCAGQRQAVVSTASGTTIWQTETLPQATQTMWHTTANPTTRWETIVTPTTLHATSFVATTLVETSVLERPTTLVETTVLTRPTTLVETTVLQHSTTLYRTIPTTLVQTRTGQATTYTRTNTLLSTATEVKETTLTQERRITATQTRDTTVTLLVPSTYTEVRPTTMTEVSATTHTDVRVSTATDEKVTTVTDVRTSTATSTFTTEATQTLVTTETTQVPTTTERIVVTSATETLVTTATDIVTQPVTLTETKAAEPVTTIESRTTTTTLEVPTTVPTTLTESRTTTLEISTTLSTTLTESKTTTLQVPTTVPTTLTEERTTTTTTTAPPTTVPTTATEERTTTTTTTEPPTTVRETSTATRTTTTTQPPTTVPTTLTQERTTTTTTTEPPTTIRETSTATTTTSTTTTSVETTRCTDPVGLPWAHYSNPTSYEASDFESVAPDDSGVVANDISLAVANVAQRNFYGSSKATSSSSFALMLKGYFKAPTAGTYTIVLSDVDDAVRVWTGTKAKSGYTNQNADLAALYDTSSQTPGGGSFSVSLTAGQFLPIRFFALNYGASSGFTVAIQRDGAAFNYAPYLVQTSCFRTDTDAAPFNGWGTATMAGRRCNDVSGLTWAHFLSPYDQTQPSVAFEPTYFKNKAPDDSGVTTSPTYYYQGALAAADKANYYVLTDKFYGSTKASNASVFALQLKGYFVAPAAGTYTLALTGIDDTAFLWSEGLAQSGWTRANSKTTTSSGTYQLVTPQLARGRRYPIRVVLGNTGGPGGIAFTLTDSAGNTLSPSTAYEQYNCAAEYNAPQFSAWGSET